MEPPGHEARHDNISWCLFFCVSTAREADSRARGRATPATGEREASPGSDGGVGAGTGADGFTAAAILQVRHKSVYLMQCSRSGVATGFTKV